MRSKVTVVLLFLNVVLFAYIYYYDKPVIDAQMNLSARRRVLPTEIASMDSLTRMTRTGDTVKLEKRGETWWLTKPYEWPANGDAVAHIHNELQFLEHETSFPVADLAKSGQSLADYGLVDPALTLVFTTGGKAFTLKIGDDTKVGNRLYVLSPDGSRVHVVGRSLAETVGLPLGELRNDAIFTVPVFEVRSLNIQTAAPSNLKVRLRRDAASRWGFESPILARAAKTAVEVTINSLNGLNAKSFIAPTDADLDRTGLNAPGLRVTLEGNARRETLLLGNPAPAAGEFYAKIEDKPVVFTVSVPAPLLEVLRSSQESLRDTHVVDFDPAAVTALTITAPGQPELALQKLEPTAPAPGAARADAATPREGWQVVTRSVGQAPVTVPGDPAVITELLKKVQLLSARVVGGKPRFLSDAPTADDVERFGFKVPEREITLNLNTGGGVRGNEPTSVVLQVGVSLKPDELGKAYARLTNPPFVYEIVPDILDQTPVVARHYRQRQLRDLPEGARVTSVSLVDLGTNAPIYAQKLKEGDKTWDAAIAAEPEAVRPSLTGILAGLRQLRAQNFVADSFNPDHAESGQGPRPWRFRLDYTIAFNEADASQGTPASLLLTERLGGASQLAGTADFGGVVFTLTQEMIDALFPLLYSTKHDPGPVPPVTPPAAAASSPAAATPPAAAAPSPVPPVTAKP